MSERENPGWLRAIDEALVAAHLGIASESDDYNTAKRKLGELIDWHVQVALDPAVNGGWKLVPVEPSEEMLAATSWPGCAGTDYRHMLAAAPRYVDTSALTSSERFRVPGPMSEDEFVEIYRALPKNGPIVRDGSTTIRLARAIEAEVLRRVKEVNNG